MCIGVSNWCNFVFTTVYILVSVGSSTAPYKKGSWGEKALIKDLLHDYEKRARPVVDGVSKEIQLGASRVQQITVEFGLGLIQILQLNENEQILTVSVKSLYRWPDHHLIWNPEDYDNITHITIPTSKIWIPDIALYNYADERLEERRECAAQVNHNGIVEWYPMAIYKSTCPVKIKYFPYDKQNCNLRFGPWTYDNARVNISFYESNWNLKDYVPSPEWNLLDHFVTIRERKYECCPEVYSDMIFQIKIERQPAYYNYLLILPCFLLSSLTLVLFWLPPEKPAKMVLGLNIFLAFFLLLLLLEDSIPSASSSFPLIGNYYCTNMTLVTVSTFLCLIVVNLHFRGDRRTDVPHWLRTLAIKHGARWLFVNVSPPKTPTKKSAKPPQSPTKARRGTNPQMYKTPCGYPSGFGMLQSDSFHRANAGYPRQAIQCIPCAECLHPWEGYRSKAHYALKYSQQFGEGIPFDGYTKLNAPTDHRGSVGRCNRYPSYKVRNSRVENPSGSNAFCPACAGLAAAAAVGGMPLNQEDPDLEDTPTEEQQSPLPLQAGNYSEDPSEELAKVWATAMTGPAPCRQCMTNAHIYDNQDGNENVDGTTSVRNRSMSPDLETFLLECVRPKKARGSFSKRDRRWVSPSHPPQWQNQHYQPRQGLPPSPFYPFSSPACDEEQDYPSAQRWTDPISPQGQANRTGPANDDETQDSEADDLWRTESGGSLHLATKQTSVKPDPVLFRRVQALKRDVSEIVRGIRFMQKQNANKEKANKSIAEWRAVGMVLDRFFFIIYLCALGISIIVYFPRSGDDAEDGA